MKDIIEHAAEPISRPMNCVEADRLWARYAALLRTAERTKTQENETFLVRQQLAITDRHHKIYQLAVKAEAPLLDAQANLAEVSRAMSAAAEESRTINAANKAAIAAMANRVQESDQKRTAIQCQYSTALTNTQYLSGLRAKFWRLFGGTQPGSDETCLPPELFNEVSSLGFDPNDLKRDLPACK